MSIHKLKNGKWQIRWRENGKQRAETCDTHRHAKRRMIEILSEAKKPKGKEPITFKEFCVKWWENYCKIEKTETAWEPDASTIRRHLLPGIESKLLSELSPNDLTEIKIRLKQKGYKPKTVNNVLLLGKRILEVAVEWEYLVHNPWRRVKLLKKAEQAFDFWSKDELERFLAFARDKDKTLHAIVAIAAYAGLRKGEILGLKRDRIDYDRKQIAVSRNYSDQLRKCFEYTKNKKIRVVPMCPYLVETLKPYRLMGMQNFLFPQEHWRFTVRFRRMCKEASIKVIRFHDLRHTFASHMVMDGIPLHTLARLLGHSSTDMTERYAHLSPDYLQGITDRLFRGNVREVFAGTEGKVINLRE